MRTAASPDHWPRRDGLASLSGVYASLSIVYVAFVAFRTQAQPAHVHP